MKLALQNFLFGLILEIIILTILNFFPAYTFSGSIIFWMTLLCTLVILYYYLVNILHGKKVILTIIGSITLSIPLIFVTALMQIGLGKATALGLQVNLKWYEYIYMSLIFISIFCIFPAIFSFIYWIFNRKNIDT